MLEGILLAVGVSLINVILAIAIIFRAFRGEESKFNKTVFLSMTLRIVGNILACGFIFLLLDIDRMAFGLTFLISTFIFIFSEILFLNYKAKFFKFAKSKE
jgi:hypothetical protein